MRTAQLRARWQSGAGRSVAGSLVASGGLQLLVIISGVLVARSLGPEDRGYFALLIVIGGVCALVGNLGLPAAATYYIAQEPGHARRIASSLRPIFLLQLAVTLLLQAAVLAALVQGDPRRVQVAAAISLLLPPGILALSYGVSILQGQRRFFAFNVLRILPSVAYVAGVVFVFFVESADLVRLMVLWTGVNFVGGFLALAISLRGLAETPDSEPVPSRGKLTRFGLKAVLGTLSPVDVVRLDQAVVGVFLNPVVLGLYVVAQAFTNLPRVVAASIGMVAYPNVAAESDRAAGQRRMWRFFAVGVVSSAVIVGGLELVTGELVSLFFGTEFTAATPIAQILLVGTFFVAARRVLTDGVNGLGKPGLGTIAEVASWVLLIPGLVIFLPRFGGEGVALALAVAWGGSLLLLMGLAVLAGRTPGWPETRLSETRRRLGAVSGRVPIRRVLGAAGAVLLAVLGGLAAAFFPTLALALVVTLLFGLFFAFGRRVLAEHGRLRIPSLRQLHASPPSGAGLPEDVHDDGLAFPRRLYYGGVLTLGLLTVRAGGALTLSDLLFLFSLMFACAEFVILRRRVPIKLPFLLSVGIAIFAVGGFLSTFESYQAFHSIAVIGRIIFLTVFWFWLGTAVLQRREHVTTAVSLWVTSAAICGGGAILQIVAGNKIPGGYLEGGRAGGFTTHPNELGGLTAIAFVPALMLATRPGLSFGRRLSSYVLLLMVAAGLILSGSVGSILAAIVAISVWLAFNRVSIHALHVFATLAACVLALTTLQAIRGAPTPIDRFRSTTTTSFVPGSSQSLGSVDQRIGTYRVNVARIKKDPFVGVGLDIYSVTRPFGQENDMYDSHNIIIGLWYKTGLVGLVGMLLAFFAIFQAGWRSMSASTSDAEWQLAVALVSSFAAFIVFAMSEPVLFSRFGWISAALVLALRSVQPARLPKQLRAAQGAERLRGARQVLAPSRP